MTLGQLKSKIVNSGLPNSAEVTIYHESLVESQRLMSTVAGKEVIEGKEVFEINGENEI